MAGSASGENFFRYARRLSEQHRHHFESRPLAEERIWFFTEVAERSREQAAIEAADAGFRSMNSYPIFSQG